MANPCSTCRPFRTCPGFPWYKPSEIQYCRVQNIYLIKEFLINRGGFVMMTRDTWPSDEYVSGYTDAPPTQHSISFHAPYELVVQVVGELERRLENTGKDGQILVLEVLQGGYLSFNGNNALHFVTGRKRKRMSYQDWLTQRGRRIKMKPYGLQKMPLLTKPHLW